MFVNSYEATRELLDKKSSIYFDRYALIPTNKADPLTNCVFQTHCWNDDDQRTVRGFRTLAG